MSETKLLPCPFCQSVHIYLWDDGAVRPKHKVVCPDCGTEGPVVSSESEAIAAWNARPAPALTPKQEAAEDLYEALNAFMNLPHLDDDVCVDARPECKVCAAINIGRSALAKAGRA